MPECSFRSATSPHPSSQPQVNTAYWSLSLYDIFCPINRLFHSAHKVDPLGDSHDFSLELLKTSKISKFSLIVYFFQNNRQPQSLCLGHGVIVHVILLLPRVQDRRDITSSLDTETLPLAQEIFETQVAED